MKSACGTFPALEEPYPTPAPQTVLRPRQALLDRDPHESEAWVPGEATRTRGLTDGGDPVEKRATL